MALFEKKYEDYMDYDAIDVTVEALEMDGSFSGSKRSFEGSDSDDLGKGTSYFLR